MNIFLFIYLIGLIPSTIITIIELSKVWNDDKAEEIGGFPLLILGSWIISIPYIYNLIKNKFKTS